MVRKRILTVEVINRSTGEWYMLKSPTLPLDKSEEWLQYQIPKLFPKDHSDTVYMTIDSCEVPDYYEGNILF